MIYVDSKFISSDFTVFVLCHCDIVFDLAAFVSHYGIVFDFTDFS